MMKTLTGKEKTIWKEFINKRFLPITAQNTVLLDIPQSFIVWI